MKIYVDLDETLIGNVVDANRNIIKIIPRPDVNWFLRLLASRGELWLLTLGTRDHAEDAMKALGRSAELFRGMITREDLIPVEDQILVVMETPGLTLIEQEDLWDLIKPIAPPGIMFDDHSIGSGIWLLKSKAIGIDEASWIKVEAFGPNRPDRNGLRKAYAEFSNRVGIPQLTMGRMKKRGIHAGSR